MSEKPKDYVHASTLLRGVRSSSYLLDLLCTILQYGAIGFLIGLLLAQICKWFGR